MKHKPDFEMEIMRRGLRDLASMSQQGRRRVLAYWCARAETLETAEDGLGEQQLDIEEVPMMPALKGAAA
jgi:hypothetical protein